MRISKSLKSRLTFTISYVLVSCYFSCDFNFLLPLLYSHFCFVYARYKDITDL